MFANGVFEKIAKTIVRVLFLQQEPGRLKWFAGYFFAFSKSAIRPRVSQLAMAWRFSTISNLR